MCHVHVCSLYMLYHFVLPFVCVRTELDENALVQVETIPVPLNFCQSAWTMNQLSTGCLDPPGALSLQEHASWTYFIVDLICPNHSKSTWPSEVQLTVYQWPPVSSWTSHRLSYCATAHPHHSKRHLLLHLKVRFAIRAMPKHRSPAGIDVAASVDQLSDREQNHCGILAILGWHSARIGQVR